MLSELNYYELCLQGFASLKREIADAEQHTVQLYNTQIEARRNQMQAQANPDEIFNKIVEEKIEEDKNVHHSKKQDN